MLTDKTRSLLMYGLSALIVLCLTALTALDRMNADQLMGALMAVLAAMGWAHVVPPGKAAAVPPAALAVFLLVGGCHTDGYTFEMGVRAGHPQAAAMQPLAGGMRADLVIMTPQAPSGMGCPTGKSCLAANSTGGRLYAVDNAGSGFNVGDALYLQPLSSAPSGVSGRTYYDTMTSKFMGWSGSWSEIPTAISTTNLTNKTLTNPAINGTVTTSGLTMPTFSMGSAKITSLGAPSSGGDGVNKTYADALRVEHFHGHADTASGTKYLGPAATGAASSTQIVLFTATQALTLVSLACVFDTAPGGPGGGLTDTVKAVVETAGVWADSSGPTTCATTGTAVHCIGSTSSAIAQYDRVGLQIVVAAMSSSAGYDCEALLTL